MSTKATYGEKLRDPRWQKRRLQILERDHWACHRCLDDKSTLNVHHRFYAKSGEPWDVPDEALITLCEDCHEHETINRPECEALLLEASTRCFLADDLYEIASGLYFAEFAHPPDVVARAIGFLVADGDGQHALVALADAVMAKRTEEAREERVRAAESASAATAT